MHIKIFETTATEITQTRYSTQKIFKSIDCSLHPMGLISNNKTSQNNGIYFKNKHPKQQVI